MMSDLPAERLVYRQPLFSSCSVDCFGPFCVTILRSSEKHWGYLLTCVTTRAIHIELVPSIIQNVLDIERLISRRGTPSIIWSDNGTNFVVAEKTSFFCASKIGTQKLFCCLFTKALSGSIIHLVHHIKVEHGSEWRAGVSAFIM